MLHVEFYFRNLSCHTGYNGNEMKWIKIHCWGHMTLPTHRYYDSAMLKKLKMLFFGIFAAIILATEWRNQSETSNEVTWPWSTITTMILLYCILSQNLCTKTGSKPSYILLTLDLDLVQLAPNNWIFLIVDWLFWSRKTVCRIKKTPPYALYHLHPIPSRPPNPLDSTCPRPYIPPHP